MPHPTVLCPTCHKPVPICLSSDENGVHVGTIDDTTHADCRPLERTPVSVTIAVNGM